MTKANEYPPIIVFAYKRKYHLDECIKSLKRNSEVSKYELIINIDGCKGSKDKIQVDEVYEYAKQIKGFKSIIINKGIKNSGLSLSVINGLDSVFKKYDRAIILEDDLVVSSYFLQYMTEALSKYEDNNNVASIHGYTYPINLSNLNEDTFFLRGGDCWGWGTWRRAWNEFEKNASILLEKLRENSLVDIFDLDGAFPYSNMLNMHINGRIDTWAVRWHASCFIKNRLTLYPRYSLVKNIGNDSTGTHCGTYTIFDVDLCDRKISINNIKIMESKIARKKLVEFFSFEKKLWRKIYIRIKSTLIKISNEKYSF